MALPTFKDLCIDAGDADDLGGFRARALWATVVDATSFRWVVVADPEGGEFCAVAREVPPAERLDEVAVDALDSEAERLRRRDDDIRRHVLADPEGNEFRVFERP